MESFILFVKKSRLKNGLCENKELDLGWHPDFGSCRCGSYVFEADVKSVACHEFSLGLCLEFHGLRGDADVVADEGAVVDESACAAALLLGDKDVLLGFGQGCESACSVADCNGQLTVSDELNCHCHCCRDRGVGGDRWVVSVCDIGGSPKPAYSGNGARE